MLAEKKPVIASMADVAASGGYYMAMAAGVVLAEPLTLTGSIGVVSGAYDVLIFCKHLLWLTYHSLTIGVSF